jgi:hypothetical protein
MSSMVLEREEAMNYQDDYIIISDDKPLTDFETRCELHGVRACTHVTCGAVSKADVALAWNKAAVSADELSALINGDPWGVNPVFDVLGMTHADRDEYASVLMADEDAYADAYYHDGMSDDR